MEANNQSENDSLLFVFPPVNENLTLYDAYVDEHQELWEFCVWESIVSITKLVSELLLMNLFFGLIVGIGIPKWAFHFISMLTGLYCLFTMSQDTTGMIVVFICFLSAYHILLLDLKITETKSHNKIVKIIQKITLIDHGLVVLLVLFQYAILDPFIWLGIRGVMMVFIMKMISLFHDIKAKSAVLPTLYEFMGYIFCGVNVMFGPWISYETYIDQLKYPTKKNLLWIFGVLRAYVISLCFLVTSNCLTTYFIPDDSNRFLLGYKEALTYRTSHYFISFLSEAMMLAAGWKNAIEWFDERQWHFTVTEPLDIEFPPHLAAVVVKWNLPMHLFLKKYIYRRWIQHGRFWAILMTFVMSSLFHGFEVKVSVVLISIGVFSYVQILVRNRIADLLNCCVRVKHCDEKHCKHKYKTNGWLCRTLKLICCVFTVLHLIFLGVLMDPTTDQIGIYQKWYDLYFFSLWIMLFDSCLINLI